MPDTERVARTRWLLLAWLSSLAWLGSPGTLRADPAPVQAKVVFLSEPRVYVAIPDSLALAPGDRVTFRLKSEVMASGSVSRVVDGELAVVTLDSGSLASVKKLDRLVVLGEKTQVAALPLLRVGYPAAARNNLLFACSRVAFVPPLPMGAYRTDVRDERSSLMLRSAAVPEAASWPESLLVRFFDDSSDEEIAIERGELDVAVFWPGELSRHMREQSRWSELLYGTWPRGFVGAFALGSSAGSPEVVPDPAVLNQLDHDLFRGDLEVIGARPGGSRPYGPIRFEVDLACPGRREMQRLLDSFSTPTTARRARLAYVGAPLAAVDSLRAATRVTPLLRLRCPVVCAPGVRGYVTALGPASWVEALDCRPVAHEP